MMAIGLQTISSMFRGKRKGDKRGDFVGMSKFLVPAIVSFLLITSALLSTAYEYRYGVKAQECEQRCFQSPASAECLAKCNEEYNMCRDAEERALREENRKAEIVPPNVWTPDGLKPAK
jgi:hypothetical protein